MLNPTMADIQALIALCATASAADRPRHRRALTEALQAIYRPGVARQMAQRFISEARRNQCASAANAGKRLKD